MYRTNQFTMNKNCLQDAPRYLKLYPSMEFASQTDNPVVYKNNDIFIIFKFSQSGSR